MGLIDDLTAIADDIYGVRDDDGAAIQNVYLVTRTWTGTEPGDGTSTDVVAQMLPTPAIINLEHNFHIERAGRYKKGDLLLKGISKGTYSTQASVDLSSNDKAIEKFYRINGELYTMVSIKESYISWDVQIRKVMS